VPQVVRYGIDADAAHRFGLPCGGLIELVLEPVQDRTRLNELLQQLEAGQRVRRRLTLATGEVDLEIAGSADELALSDTHLVTHHGPSWRLIIIGAGQLTQYLAPMAAALGYEVLVCDPRQEYTTGFQADKARLVPGMPDDVVRDLQPDGHTAVIALTHDPKLDDLALMEVYRFKVSSQSSLLYHPRLEHIKRRRMQASEAVDIMFQNGCPPRFALCIANRPGNAVGFLKNHSEEILRAENIRPNTPVAIMVVVNWAAPSTNSAGAMSVHNAILNAVLNGNNADELGVVITCNCV
jgi:hypothetical protein